MDAFSGMGVLALAFTLVILTFITLFYTISLNWALASITQIMGIFIPLDSAIVAFYFGNKNSNGLIDNENKRLNNENQKLLNEHKRFELAEKGITAP
jgi:sensor histidine kinase YesM